MRLKSIFVIYSTTIFLIFIFLVIQLEVDIYLFIVCEALIAISLFITIWMYRGISQPFKLIALAIESIKDKDFNSRLTFVGHQEIDALIAAYNQMIDHLREERIKQSETNHFLDKLVQASPSGIITLDSLNRIESINLAAQRILNLDQKSFRGMDLKCIPGKLPLELTNLKDGTSEIISISGIEVYKCQKAHFTDRGFSHHFIMIEALTIEIYKKEKNAYEKVIRMMSHETNNSIGAINSILSTFINYKDQLKPEYQADYENALNVAINRNAALSAIISNFAKVVKIPEPVKENASLHTLLKSVQVLMDASCRDKQIEWQWQLSDQDHIIEMDVQQMEQVLINVLKNSIEAVANEGKIIIRTSTNPLTLSVLNNGTGISPEVTKKLFTPFFSTKKNGQGIGLTVIREILVNHNFNFSLEFDGELTEFKIVFSIA